MSSTPFHESIPRYHQIAQVLRQRAARRELGGAPLSLVVSYMPGSLAPVITRQALASRILHEVLWHKLGLFQKKSTHTIRVARADGAVARELGIALSDPVLHIRSRGYL